MAFGQAGARSRPSRIASPIRAGRVPAGLLVALAGLLSAPSPGGAQAAGGEGGSGVVDPEEVPRPEATAIRAGGPIRVDGRLDEPAWDSAAVLEGFVQAQPDPGHPATRRTVVRVLYDDHHLYFGIFAEADPEEIVVTTLERDYGGRSTRDFDVVAITLDTFLDRRNAFMFHVNPEGAIRDAQVFDDSRSQNAAWQGAWEAATMVSDSGWTAEVAIPFTTLRFDPDVPIQDWGLNVLRRNRYNNEDSYWAPLDRRDPVHRMSKAGTLRGLENLGGGRDRRVKPYVATGHAGRDEPGVEDPGGSVDGGVDFKYGVTPQLTLDLTLNTDFSQVEVDQERVDLSRFPLFFPEQRDFFQENAGSFTFGDVSERGYRSGASLRDFTLFHSRRIGLGDQGRPLPILGGGRLTGRAGSYELGLLNIQTRSAPGHPAENFALARVRRTIGTGSDVGFLVGNRQRTDGDGEGRYNRSAGADANLRLFGNLMVNSYVAATDEPGVDGDRFAGRVAVGWRDQFFNTSAFVRRVDEDFNPGVGFVRRPGTRHHYATFGVHPRPGIPYVQELAPFVETHYVTGGEAGLLTRTHTAGIGVEFLDGGSLTVEGSENFERLTRDFVVQSGAVIPPADYRFREGSVRYQSSGARSLVGRLQVGGGGFFHGDRASVSVQGEWFPGPRWSFDFTADHNRIDLPGVEPFTADVFAGGVQHAASTRLFSGAAVQYNTATEQMVSSARLNFIHAPLSDLYLVFIERRDVAEGRVMERFFTAKVTRTVAF